jgi:hypothetical protein
MIEAEDVKKGPKKPPYYWVDQETGMGYWSPKKHMRDAGFANIRCGRDGPEAQAIAWMWAKRWKDHKSGVLAGNPREVWPSGSLGEAFERFRRTSEWSRKAPRTREDWDRGWNLIKPVFGAQDPKTVTLEDMSLWYAGDPDDPGVPHLLHPDPAKGGVGVREAHRAVKIWRALWQVAAALKYCNRDEDPSFGIRRKTPKGRSARWDFEEVRRLVKRSLRMRRRGLACVLAIMWDSQFSPVDVRTLRARHRKIVGGRLVFDRNEGRGKAQQGEEKAVVGTLSRRTERLVNWYLAEQFGKAELHPDTILFLSPGSEPVSRKGKKGEWGGNHGGGKPRQQGPYSKDLLSKDFGRVREAEFGVTETRQMIDMRRSASVEALAGQVDPGVLAAKMGNTIDESRELQRTYLPAQVAVVRMADEARVVGRRRLRKDKE